MEGDTGKLFIGGISWDTTEDCLKAYFEMFGEVLEAVIMKDRTTGRARGFGFIVFSDPNIADLVIKEKHIIDGRTVEAKKAVPRDEQQTPNRNINSNISSNLPGPTRSKKIFVGGLASTVTEKDFKTYFEQFGVITDVVVMYDHNTQRPRGFGFITYDSEESVDLVLNKTFHELNGKMVEVKRAVPKETSSPAISRTPLSNPGFNYNLGLTRVNSLLNPGFNNNNPNLMGNYGGRMVNNINPINVNRNQYSPFGPSSYQIGSMLDIGNIGNLNSTLGFGRELYRPGPGPTGASLNSPSRTVWGGINNNNTNNSFGFIGSGSSGGSGNVNNTSLSAFDGSINGRMWNSLAISGQYVENNGENISSKFGFGGIGRMNERQNDGFNSFYDDRSFYANPTWNSLSPNLERSGSGLGSGSGSGLFEYGLGNSSSDVVVSNNPVGYVGGNSVVTSRSSNRGIAA